MLSADQRAGGRISRRLRVEHVFDNRLLVETSSVLVMAQHLHPVALPTVDLREWGRLTDLEIDVLAFERSWWKFEGAKETAARERFGHSSTRPYQLLDAVTDRPEALAHDPLLIRRLRRLREERAKQRSSKRLGFDL
jgi:hypothetical protein